MASLKRAGIIFDFDDTLVYSHEIFLGVQQRFCERMQQLELYDEELLADVEARDIANVSEAGFMAAECFPIALGQTYEDYCVKYGRAAETKEKESLIQLGWQVYQQAPREMEGAQGLLAQLRQCGGGYRLLLFTQGERQIQHQRIVRSGFGDCFDAVKIVRHKNTAALETLLAEQSLDPSLSWYVGNSLRADINPAIEAGLSAVHLDVQAWRYEHETPIGHYHSINKLEQFWDLLQERLGAAR